MGSRTPMNAQCLALLHFMKAVCFSTNIGSTALHKNSALANQLPAHQPSSNQILADQVTAGRHRRAVRVERPCLDRGRRGRV
jgi:hypothetical protein